jgi:hypothetical protein
MVEIHVTAPTGIPAKDWAIIKAKILYDALS